MLDFVGLTFMPAVLAASRDKTLRVKMSLVVQVPRNHRVSLIYPAELTSTLHSLLLQLDIDQALPEVVSSQLQRFLDYGISVLSWGLYISRVVL